MKPYYMDKLETMDALTNRVSVVHSLTGKCNRSRVNQQETDHFR